LGRIPARARSRVADSIFPEFQVKLIVAVLAVPAMLIATASPARERPLLSLPADTAKAGDADADAAPAAAPAWRATHVNRCTDANRRVKLQDVPCAPPTPTAAEATAAPIAAAMVELSALEPRPSVERCGLRHGAPGRAASRASCLPWRGSSDCSSRSATRSFA